MEKIIYNTKLNKILASFLIVIILFGYISPIRVNAESETSCSLTEYIKMISGKSDLKKALSAVEADEIIDALIEYDDRYKNMDPIKIEEMIFWYEDVNDELYHFYGEGTTITYNDSYEITDVSTDGKKVIVEDLYFWLYYSEKYNYVPPTYSNCEYFKNSIEGKYKGNYINTGVDESGEIYIEIYVKNPNDISANVATFLGITEDTAEEICQEYIGDTEYGLFIKMLDSSEFTEEREEELEGATTQEEKELIILRHYLEDLDLDGNPDTLDRFKTTTIDGMIELYKSGGDQIKVTWNNDRTEVLDVDFDSSYFGKDVLGETLYNEEVKEEVDDSWDIGGILLSPVFYLINFVADAIIGNLEDIMTGEGLATGFDILRLAKTPPEEGKEYYNYEINMDSLNLLGTVQYPNIKYTPEEIFSGKFDLLSIDFISGQTPERDENGNIKYENGKIKYSNNSDSGWGSVREVISAWYKVLRMIAIIGLLSVLIYTGIKIIISANAKDKAKYKEWIINWFIAVAILFSMHYIMSFIISLTREINNLLSNACQGIKIVNGADESVTNLMGLVRFMIQAEDFYIKIGYEVMYIALIVYTVKFTMIYLKRVLNMAFLTLIAPIVALTYPIDKINDGKAQGFDMWLKEYIYNALLQPMHYVMYYILLGSAVSIAASNPLYGIVVLMFMTEAEKLLKKIFGFDKAGGGTVGGMAGAFAAGAIASNIKNIARMSKLPGGNGGKDGSGGKVDDYLKEPKPVDTDDKDDILFGGDGSENSERPEEPDSQPGTSVANAFQDSSDPVAASEREALEEKLADGQLTEDDLTDEQKEMLGINPDPNNPDPNNPDPNNPDPNNPDPNNPDPNNPDPNSPDSNNPDPNNPDPNSPDSNNPDSNNSDEEDDKWKGRMNGLKNVGKKLAKPVWDFDVKDNKYNRRRLYKKVGRGVLGASLGIGAAAVQAGISITDGKYNPMEGVATFSAGYAGGGQISRGVGSLIDTYRDGRDEGNKKEIMKRATEKWGQREDVIAYNKKKYDEKDRQKVLEIQKKLLEQGITDTGEMHKCIKYIKSINNGKIEGATDDMIRKSRVLHDFRKEMSDQGVNIYEENKRNEYINSVAKTDKERQILRAKFKAAVDYDDAQK